MKNLIKNIFVIIFLFIFAGNSEIIIKPDSGSILLWKSKIASWIEIKDSSEVDLNDSISINDKFMAKIFFDKNFELLLKDELLAHIRNENDSFIVINLIKGQILLKKIDTTKSNIKVVLRKCAFMPFTNVVAGVKYTKKEEPTSAVICGRLLIEPPAGAEPAIVNEGEYGYFNPISAKIKTGKLSKEAISSLEKWAQMKQEKSLIDSLATDSLKILQTKDTLTMQTEKIPLTEINKEKKDSLENKKEQKKEKRKKDKNKN
jgi:hypothetical protein